MEDDVQNFLAQINASNATRGPSALYRGTSFTKNDIGTHGRTFRTSAGSRTSAAYEGGRALGIDRRADEPAFVDINREETLMFVSSGAQDSDFNAEQKILSDLLRKAIITNTARAIEFIPIDKIKSILSEENVLKLLQTMGRGIFATLLLLDQTKDIVDFFDAGLNDEHLPFQLSNSRDQLKLDNGNMTNLRLNWKSFIYESFVGHYQWMVFVPVFDLSDGPRDRYDRNILYPKQVLPELPIDIPPEKARGGYSEVRRVLFHPAHHNLNTDSGPRYFAIKTAESENYETFREEKRTLKRLGTQRHQAGHYLIQLRGTFEQMNKYHLIFDWADGGNLENFWETNGDVDSLPRGPSLAIWMTRQFLGLAQGLQAIHRCAFDPRGSQRSMTSDSMPIDEQRIHGAHCDIKPANILWFTQDGDIINGVKLGHMKLSDFGLSSFHNTKSKSAFQLRGYTGTHSAPEFEVRETLDIPQYSIGQEYDMWSFGCVLLEFVTWYLQGWKGYGDFEQKRKRRMKPPLRFYTDKFFTVTKYNAENQGLRAVRNSAVSKHIHHLRKLPRTPPFVIELLDLVDKNLLRMRPKNRIVIHEAVQKLEAVYESCKKDPQYSLAQGYRRQACYDSDRSELLREVS